MLIEQGPGVNLSVDAIAPTPADGIDRLPLRFIRDQLTSYCLRLVLYIYLK